jgi:hypothetical protein
MMINWKAAAVLLVMATASGAAEIERPKIALAKVDKAPWYGITKNPTSNGVIPNGSPFQQQLPAAPAMKPAPLPPAEFDRPYTGGQMIVTKWNDYNLLRLICKDDPTAIACSYRVYDSETGKPISCLIMLGPIAHNDPRVLRHEIGHCNGWSNKHEGARLSER